MYVIVNLHSKINNYIYLTIYCLNECKNVNTICGTFDCKNYDLVCLLCVPGCSWGSWVARLEDCETELPVQLADSKAFLLPPHSPLVLLLAQTVPHHTDHSQVTAG